MRNIGEQQIVSFPELTLLDAVVEITAQRDQESLAEAMVRVVSHLQQGSSTCLYSLGGELGNLSAKVIASSDSACVGTHIAGLENRPPFRQCIDSQQPIVLQQADGCQLIYPVREQDKVVGLLVCSGVKDSILPSEIFGRLLAIYANHFHLLNHQHRDALTGLFNRAALDDWLLKILTPDGEVIARRARDGDRLGCFAIFDIDHFKKINDSLGHLYGDEVLLIFADLMRESFRFNDLLFRYGGEEFVAVLSETDLEAAYTVLERFRARVAAHAFPQINQVTVSIGVTEIQQEIPPSTLIERADRALYHGKNHGRDQVNAYENLQQGRAPAGPDQAQRTIELF